MTRLEILLGEGEGGAYLLLGGEVDADGFALVAVVGLEDDGAVKVLGGVPGVIGCCDDHAAGDGHADFVEELFGRSLSEAISTPILEVLEVSEAWMRRA